MAHRGSCQKTARITETDSQRGLLIKFEGECSCKPKPLMADVIEQKIEFMKQWQGKEVFTAEFLGALKSVGRKIEQNAIPFMSHAEKQIIIEHLEPERFETLLSGVDLTDVFKLKLVGGNDSSVEKEVVEKTKTSTTSTDEGSTSVELTLKGKLFEFLGIEAFCAKFIHQRSKTSTATTTTRTT